MEAGKKNKKKSTSEAAFPGLNCPCCQSQPKGCGWRWCANTRSRERRRARGNGAPRKLPRGGLSCAPFYHYLPLDPSSWSGEGSEVREEAERMPFALEQGATSGWMTDQRTCLWICRKM